eukprot:GHVN01000006.1.p3 GENE.GHVN01000006.1~~GHVN01000006.1.p3  ORF type:complete len:148 (-),score=5.68 GHVN01000006.1:2361-2804(-)
MVELLHPKRGVLFNAIVNEGAFGDQQSCFPNDRNFHIYTWNSLIFGNLLTSAGAHTCGCRTLKTKFPHTDYARMDGDRHKLCMDALAKGEESNYTQVYCVAVSPDLLNDIFWLHIQKCSPIWVKNSGDQRRTVVALLDRFCCRLFAL